MKKRLSWIALFIFFSFYAAQAQEVGTRFGLKVGLNSANFGGDDDTKTRFGYHGGPYLSIGISENFAIQPELLYSTQGAEVTANNVSRKQDLSYINLPIMAKIYVANGFNIQVGPYVGVLLDFDSHADDNTASVKVDYKGYDFGVGLGLAYEFTGGFNFGARYNFGLADISDFDADAEGISIDGRTNQVLQFFVGVTF